MESLETVPLLARAIESAGVQAPITTALAKLIDGSLPLEEWVGLVRVAQPELSQGVGRFVSFWRRLRARFRRRRAQPMIERG